MEKAKVESPKITSQEIRSMVDSWRQDEIKRRDQSLKGFADILKPFKEKGFDRITVSYDGCGDSGEIHDTYFEINGKSCSPYVWKNMNGKTFNKMPEEWKEFEDKEPNEGNCASLYDSKKLQGFLNPLHEACYNILTYDWYNNEGGHGAIKIDLKNMTIEVEAAYRVEESQSVSENDQQSYFQLDY